MTPAHVFVNTTFEDAKGAKSSLEYKFPTAAAGAANIAALIDAAKTGATLLDAVTKGRILDVSIGIKVDISALSLKGSATSDSDVEEGARLQFNTAVDSLTGFRIPTFDEDFLLSGTKVVDLEDTDIADLVDFFVDGHTLSAVTVQPSDERGADIEAIVSARESFQSSRN